MMTKEYFHALFEHDLWANLSLLESYFTHPEPVPEAHNILCHIVATQRIWIDRIKGKNPDIQEKELFDEEMLLELFEINYKDLKGLIEKSDVQQLFSYRHQDRLATKSILQALTHLALSSSFNRGQLNLLITHPSVAYNATNFISFSL